MRGILITFEGVEGSGKTTQMLRLERALRRRGLRVERTREPDGTVLGAAVRRLFERPGVRPEPLVEVFLFMAARHQHVAEKIRPWLRRGRVVLCDRYTDATVAYQGYGRGVDPDLIRELNVRATGGVLPDLTLVFDLSPEEGLQRIGRRRLDHFERLNLGARLLPPEATYVAWVDADTHFARYDWADDDPAAAALPDRADVVGDARRRHSARAGRQEPELR